MFKIIYVLNVYKQITFLVFEKITKKSSAFLNEINWRHLYRYYKGAMSSNMCGLIFEPIPLSISRMKRIT